MAPVIHIVRGVSWHGETYCGNRFKGDMYADRKDRKRAAEAGTVCPKCCEAIGSESDRDWLDAMTAAYGIGGAA